MGGERFKEQEKGCLFGDFIYDLTVPEDRFLRQLDAFIPWQPFTNLELPGPPDESQRQRS